MTKNLFFTLAILICSVLNAQKVSRKDVMSLNTVEEAKAYLEKTKSKKNKLIAFNQAKHRTILAKELLELPEGGLKIVKKEFYDTYYKVLEKKEIMSYRVSHITLSNKGLDDDEMKVLMNNIIDKYERGLPFEILVREYSIDEENVNYGGDTGWFSLTEDNNELEMYIINNDGEHGVGEIFTITPPETELYYIVLKTNEPTKVPEIKVLKIAELIE